MSGLEAVLLGTASGFLAALVAGAAAYVKLARSVMTRVEHDKECDRRMKPVRDDITDIKKTVDKLSEKQDSSTQDLTKQLQQIMLELLKINRRPGG